MSAMRRWVYVAILGLCGFWSASVAEASGMHLGAIGVSSRGLGFTPYYHGAIGRYDFPSFFVEGELLASRKVSEKKGWGIYGRIGKNFSLTRKIYVPVVVEAGGIRGDTYHKNRVALSTGLGWKSPKIGFSAGLDVKAISPTDAHTFYLRMELFPDAPFFVRVEERGVFYEQNGKKGLGERVSVSFFGRLR